MSDFHLSFIDAREDCPLVWMDDAKRTCAADRVCRGVDRAWAERRCAAIIPQISALSGVPVTAIRGVITELAPAPAEIPAPSAAAFS